VTQSNSVKEILVTGGAGFIGSHLVRELLKRKYKVRVLDCLDPQVHGRVRGRPANMPTEVKFFKGDVTNPRDVEKALNGVDAVFHLAAAVGVGQSMYKIVHYVKTNTLGGAVMLEGIVRHRAQLKKVVVASSMSIYGEGRYECQRCGAVSPQLREEEQMKENKWELFCPHCQAILTPAATNEEKPLFPTSIYAVTKRDHEECFLSVGRAYAVPTAALRFFNVYGPEQALSNPYTGVAAIFSSRLLNGNSPLVFEDGHQSRDFIHVSDIVAGCILALEHESSAGEVFNVGTGKSTSILQLADLIARHLKLDIHPTILNKFRAGDVRHCYSDISKIQKKLGYEPRIPLEKGVEDLVEWVRVQTASDKVDTAVKELHKMNLVK